jgi:hypothetical protein
MTAILTPTEIARVHLRQEREMLARLLEGTFTKSTRHELEAVVEHVDNELRALEARA